MNESNVAAFAKPEMLLFFAIRQNFAVQTFHIKQPCIVLFSLRVNVGFGNNAKLAPPVETVTDRGRRNPQQNEHGNPKQGET
jgi:hypothetical protein